MWDRAFATIINITLVDFLGKIFHYSSFFLIIYIYDVKLCS
jgi:hypothetical protein